jgi:hypothetical protein
MQEQRLEKYNKYVVAEDFILISNYNNIMELPTFLRAVVNTTSKEYLLEKKQSINALAACFLLSGQKSILTRARKSIAGFKLREGALLGCRTTLRKKKLYTVIDKLLVFALPRLFSAKKSNTNLKFSIKASLKQYSNLSLITKSSTLDQYYNRSDKSAGLASLTPEEGSQLSINLKHVKKNKSVKVVQEKGITSKGQAYHLALGIKNLLLIPELQELLPLFEAIRGINLGLSFSNPRLKGASLASIFIDHTDKLQTNPTDKLQTNLKVKLQTNPKVKLQTNPKVKLQTNPKDEKNPLEVTQCSHKYTNDVAHILLKRSVNDPGQIAHIYTNDTPIVREEIKNLLSLPFAKNFIKKRLENEDWYNLTVKNKRLFPDQKFSRHTFLNTTLYAPSDTPLAKENRKILFLTSFQFPKQYN